VAGPDVVISVCAMYCRIWIDQTLVRRETNPYRRQTDFLWAGIFKSHLYGRGLFDGTSSIRGVHSSSGGSSFFFIFCQAYRAAGEVTVATLEVVLSFLSLRGLSHLPGVDAAVTSGEGVALGILQGVQDGFVFGAEVKPNHLVDLVDHFGGSGVLRGGLGVFASCPLDTAQFFFGTRSVHDEAHATTEVGLGERGFFC